MIGRIVFVVCLLAVAHNCCRASTRDLAALKNGEPVGGLRCANLYADSEGHIVGAKFWDVRSGAPIYLLQIETVPQVFMWVDTPADSNKGAAHALEHLLGGKGTKGRYISLLKEMRLSRSVAATTDDFNLYSFSSGTGLDGFFEQLHAWLDALYRPDFTDLEAEREFYHFGISVDPATNKKTVVEKGSVYDEMQTGQGIYRYYFELNKRVFGPDNPFGFYNSGVPDEMRHVVPADIRRFHHEHYRLGPTTGFIFALSPTEDVFSFLLRISQEIDQFTDSDAHQQIHREVIKPKYSIHPPSNTKIALFPFPSNSESDRGEVRFGWKPVKTESQVELRLLQLFFRALADGDKSLLYKSLLDSKTREFGSGATNVESLVFLENSPYFPAEFVGFSGIAGKQLTVHRVEQLRDRVTATIRRISQYPDSSQSLVAFNQLVMSYAKAWRRSQSVWTKSAPQFGLNYETQWKEHLEYLEMDPSFTRSISDEPVWRAVERQVQSGRNIWGGLIRDFQLLEVPYATASVPSQQLLEEVDSNRRKRVAAKIKQLMDRLHTDDEQQALAQFEQEEAVKTKEIDEIAAQVRRPRFTDHPPLTPDDDIRYTQFRLDNVPVIATFFDRAPTIDLGLSFDLRRIPRRYYKYLPILPKCLDSLGLKTADEIISYADLQARTQTDMNDFSVRFDFSPVSQRADLRIQASTTTPAEFRRALALIQRITTLNYLDPSNADRLRDVVDKRQWEEDAYNKGENDFWFINPSNAFRYQDDLLYLTLSSVFTRAHWDSRLRWLLHKSVSPAEIARLADFAEKTLSASSGVSDKQLSETLSRSNAKGLEGELVEYWERNIPSFSQDELLAGLRRLAVEVQDDLKTGPEKTIADLRELQKIVLNRQALSIDLTLDHANLAEIQPSLAKFLESIPDSAHSEDLADNASKKTPLMDNVRRRYNLGGLEFPWYVGLEDPRNTTANMVFYADFPGYSQLDHQSLLRALSSKLVSGSGPQTVYAKIEEDGLAYGSSISSDPRLRLLRYYAARSPDIPSLVNLVNSIAAAIPQLHDESLIDYALQQTFLPPRSMSTFTERGRGIATDIRDGTDPAQVRRFSEAILKLRAEPNLLSELTSLAADAICPVLVTNECTPQQQQARSLFFFTGPERLLADAEKKLGMPKMLRIYPSDFWIGNSRESNQSVAKGAQDKYNRALTPVSSAGQSIH
jgi:Zn-dependent M16 (insulinase) family peptidase